MNECLKIANIQCAAILWAKRSEEEWPDWFDMTEKATVIQISTCYNDGPSVNTAEDQTRCQEQEIEPTLCMVSPKLDNRR